MMSSLSKGKEENVAATSTTATTVSCSSDGEAHEKRFGRKQIEAAFYEIVWPAIEQEGWTKIDPDGEEPRFVPTSRVLEMKDEGNKVGVSYDESMVISRLLERRTAAESAIADRYLACIDSLSSRDKPTEKVAENKRKLEPAIIGNGQGGDGTIAVAQAEGIEHDKHEEDETVDGNKLLGGPTGSPKKNDKASDQNQNHTAKSVAGAEPDLLDKGEKRRTKEQASGMPGKHQDQAGPKIGEDREATETKEPSKDPGDGKEDVDETDSRDPVSGLHSDSSGNQADPGRMPRNHARNSKNRKKKGKTSNEGEVMNRDHNDNGDKTKDSDGQHSPDDVSNDEGESAYESSDESQPERKRKRKAVTETSTGRGRPRGRGKPKASRPRGRPKRNVATPPPPKRVAAPTRAKKAKQEPLIDLSWKNGGKNYPKKVSRVGPQYNVTDIEPAGTWKPNESEVYCEQIWNPELAEEKLQGESIDFLSEKGIPHNKREACMVGLHEVGYDASKFDDEAVVDKVTTADGSEWSNEEREKYHSEMFRLRKDHREVSKSMGKSMNSCFAYYLGTYKQSDDYRLLKTVHYEERLGRMLDADHDLDSCAICGDGGNLLICDGCEREYHMECMRPALKSVPEGKWECDECVDRAFLEAKDSLIRNTKLFKRIDGRDKGGSIAGKNGKDRTKEKSTEGHGSMRLRPTSPVLDIVTKLGQNISAIFSEGSS